MTHPEPRDRELRTRDTLASRAYWQTFTPTPEMVVCFVPGDAVLAAALDVDPGLHEDGMAKRVLNAAAREFVRLLVTNP